jgi:hypothetical protein
MDIFEEIVEYKKNIKEATKLFAMLSAMNAQMDEALDKLLPIMVKIENPPLATQQDKEQYKNELAIVIAALKMQQRINATAGSAYCQTAVELNKLLKELEVEE